MSTQTPPTPVDPPPLGDPGAPSDEPGVRRVKITGLADRATSGFLVLVFQTVLVRVARFGGQFVLAWLLIPEDFGLFALAATLHQFVSVLKNAGLRDILVHRESKIHLWTNPAAWMSLALGLGGGVAMWAAAPFMASFFQRPELVTLVQILAVTTLVQSVGQVPTAMLHAQLRFTTAGVVEGINNIALMVLTVLFAWMGMGAVSFVLPMLIVGVARTAYLWWLLRPRVLLDPQFRRWRYLMGDSARLIGADVARTAVIQGPNVILGRLYPTGGVVGHYFYGYQLSIQSMWLFSRNLDFVLMPALSKLQADAKRHTLAFVRAAKTMACGGVPLCFLQAAAAEPAVHLLLPERFHPTIPYMVVLSIGMAGQLAVQPSTAMLRSQGRFSMFLWITWIHAAVFLTAVTLAAWLGSPLAAAATVGVVTGLFGIAYVYVSFRGLDNRAAATADVFFWPVVLGGLACGGGWLLAQLVPGESRLSDVAQLAVIGLTAVAVYVPLLRLVERPTYDEIKARTGGVAGKIGRRFKKPQPPATR